MKKTILSISTAIVISVTPLFAIDHYENERQQQEQIAPDNSNYHATLSEEDKRNIRYIIMTLATKSQVGLLFEKGALNDAGNRVAHVHTLKFLAYIFSDPQLKAAAKKIGRMPWTRFVNDMAQSLAEEAAHNDIKPEYISDFAKQVDISESLIAPAAKNGRWVEFINIIRQNTH